MEEVESDYGDAGKSDDLVANLRTATTTTVVLFCILEPTSEKARGIITLAYSGFSNVCCAHLATILLYFV